MKKLMPILLTLSLLFAIPAIALAADKAPAAAPAPQLVYLHIDSNLILKDGAITQLSTATPNIAPAVKNGTTFVPLRAVAETFTAQVSYDAASKTAIVEAGAVKGEFPIGKTAYSVNGEPKTLLAATYLSNGVTYVPLRAVCENILGLKVSYQNSVIAIAAEQPTLNADTVSRIKEQLAAVLKVPSAAKLNSLIQASRSASGFSYGAKDELSMNGLAEAPQAAADTGADDSGGGEYSTNVQVAGIDEGDIVKVEGNHIYACSGSRLVMLRAEGEDVASLGEFSVPDGYIQEMYVKDGVVALIGMRNDYVYYYSEKSSDIGILPVFGDPSTFVYVLEAEQGQFSQVKYFEIEGNYIDSRLKDGQLFLITNYYAASDGDIIPLYSDSAASVKARPLSIDRMYYSAHEPGLNYLDISTIAISDDAPAQTTTAIGSGYTVYMAADAIYAAGYYWNEDDDYGTEILKFAVGESGETALVACGSVPGYLINQFALDEYQGQLRIATSDDEGNNIFVLGPFLNVVGELRGIAEDERIYAARFLDDRGYLVTYRNIDPFFTFDLSDPANPQMLGYLELPGYSNYLHPIADNLVLGLGYDTQDIYVRDQNGQESVIGTRQGGIKLSLFDVSDPFDPVEVDSRVLGEAYSSTEASYNHKAFMADSSRGIYGFPATIYEDKGRYQRGVVLLEINRRGFADISFAEAAEPDYSSDMYFQRLIYIGDSYYYLDSGTVYLVDIADADCREVYQIGGGNSDAPVRVLID